MNKKIFAQSLVPVADELDERGLTEEATELDSIIEELISEASKEEEMTKEAQQSWYQPTGQMTDTPLNAIWDSAKQWGRSTFQGPAGQITNYQENIAKIDQQLLLLRQQEADLTKQKQQLMQQGQETRGQVAGQFGLQQKPNQVNPATQYGQDVQQAQQRLQSTQQAQ